MEGTDFQKIWKTFGIIGIICILFIILFVLYSLRELLTPFILSFIILFFLNPIVDYLEGEGMNRTFAVVLLILLSILVLFIIWRLTWPSIQVEINHFKENAPAYIHKTQAGLNRAVKLLENNLGFIPKGALENALKHKMENLTSGATDVGSFIKIIKELVTTLIIIPFVVFFLLKDGRKIKKMVIALVPNKYFETFLTLFYEVDQQVSNYIRGLLIDIVIVGLLAIIGLYLMGIKYAFFIGAIAGMANVIPYIGPLIGILFGSLLVLITTGSISSLLKLVGVFAVVKLLDDAIVNPMALSKSVHVHPLMVIVVILLGGFFHGIWGMLLAIPLYCSIKVSFQILYRGFIEYGNW